MIDIYIWIALLILILSVIGIFRIGDKGSEIISRLEFQAEQNAKIIELLTETKEQQANKK